MATNAGQFSKSVVTTAGKEMIVQAQNGHTLTFTRVALGDGTLAEGEDMLALTAIKSEKLSANISSFLDKGNGQYQLKFSVNNTTLDTGFWHREIGVMAKIDDGDEELYAYSYAGAAANFLYDKTTPVQERFVNIDVLIGSATDVTVVIDGSVIYPTRAETETMIQTHNESQTAHADIRALVENLMVVDSGAPTSNQGSVAEIINGVANMLKQIKGDSDWKNTPVISLTSILSSLGTEFEVTTDQQTGVFSVPALGITGLMAQNGYISLGRLFGGLILQWGIDQPRDMAISNTNHVISFPITFNSVFGAFVSMYFPDIDTEAFDGGVGVHNISNSQLTLGYGSTVSATRKQGAYWMAIGI
jgi:hypothetical protein